jgi:DNA-binding GntR family transcriptional regulator
MQGKIATMSAHAEVNIEKVATKGVAKGVDAVAEEISADVAAGRLTNGTWLKLVDLEVRYGCTRAAARRALERLAVKGVLQRIPDRGYYVAVMDERRRRELMAVRVVLETATVPGILTSATKADIADLRALATRFESCIRDGDAAQKFTANRDFHVRLTQLCPNQELARLALEVRGNIPSTPVVQWWTQARIEKSAREHFEMIDALEAGDGAALSRLIELHILQPDR